VPSLFQQEGRDIARGIDVLIAAMAAKENSLRAKHVVKPFVTKGLHTFTGA
jgi:hypothetical protein